MRRTPILVAVLLCAFPAAAVASAPRGVLTTQEYAQLKTAEASSKRLGASSEQAITRTRRICTMIRPNTALMQAVRADCLALSRFAVDSLKADTAAGQCTAKGSTVAQMDRCMLPSFRAYRSSARGYYLADRHVDHVAQARGLGNRCVAVLGNPQRIIAAESRLATDLGGFVSALRRANTTALQSAARRVDADSRALGGSAGSLSLCPHQ